MMAIMHVLILTLFLSSSPTPVLTSTSTESLSERSCNAAAAKLTKEQTSAYAEHLPRVTTVCVPE